MKPGGNRYSKGLRTSFRGTSFRAAVAILIVYVDWQIVGRQDPDGSSRAFPANTRFNRRFDFYYAAKEHGACGDSLRRTAGAAVPIGLPISGLPISASRRGLLQQIQFRQNIAAVPDGIHSGIGLRDLAAGVDEEGMPLGKFHQTEIGQ